MYLRSCIHQLTTQTISRHFSNYHTTLGVPPTASKKDIKSAFVSKVKLCHPDIYPDDKSKHQQFLKLHEAYEKLSQAPTDIRQGPHYHHKDIGNDNDFMFDRETLRNMSRNSSHENLDEYIDTILSKQKEKKRRRYPNIIMNVTMVVILFVLVGGLVKFTLLEKLLGEEDEHLRRRRDEMEFYKRQNEETEGKMCGENAIQSVEEDLEEQ